MRPHGDWAAFSIPTVVPNPGRVTSPEAAEGPVLPLKDTRKTGLGDVTAAQERDAWQIWHRGGEAPGRGTAGSSTAPFPRSQASYTYRTAASSSRPLTQVAGGAREQVQLSALAVCAQAGTSNGKESSTCGECAAARRWSATLSQATSDRPSEGCHLPRMKLRDPG